MSRLPRWPLVIVLSSLVLSNLVVADVHSPARVVVTLWFLLVCTGMAFVPLLSIPSLAAELALGVVLSIALDTLAATAIVIAGGLSATAGLLALEGICLAGCALQMWAWGRRRTARP
jgi:hypothetical protein